MFLTNVRSLVVQRAAVVPPWAQTARPLRKGGQGGIAEGTHANSDRKISDRKIAQLFLED
jgi:hypothetical protein